MSVNYGNKVSAPPFAKGTDNLTAAIAVTPFKESDFAIDCDGCTACCRGDDGPIINPGEVSDYQCHKDDKGNWRLDQTPEGHCVYLDDLGPEFGGSGCAIHYSDGPLEGPDPANNLGDAPTQPPRICRDFDCRSIIVKFNTRGLDFMVNSGQLPLEVVIQGRKQLKAFNDMINTRALSGGADLSALLMAPAEESSNAQDDSA